MSNRILHKGLKAKVMTAEEAAAMIPNGAILATSGFTGAGYAKAVPLALAKRAVEDCVRRIERAGFGRTEDHDRRAGHAGCRE